MLLVVEDDPGVLRTFLRCLGDRPSLWARSASEARELATRRSTWGGFIVDPGLPEGRTAGIELLCWLRERDPTAERVLMSGQPLESLAAAGDRLAATLIPKPALPVDIARALERYDSKRAADPLTLVLERGGHQHHLTSREAGLVRHVAHGDVASTYWQHAGIARTTYKTHRENILAKTGAPSIEAFVIGLLTEELRRRS